MSYDRVHDMLRASEAEGLTVTVFANGASLEGEVTSLDETSVILVAGNQQVVVYLQRIDAVAITHSSERSPLKKRIEGKEGGT